MKHERRYSPRDTPKKRLHAASPHKAHPVSVSSFAPIDTLQQMISLLAQNLFDSAQIIGDFLLAYALKTADSPISSKDSFLASYDVTLMSKHLLPENSGNCMMAWTPESLPRHFHVTVLYFYAEVLTHKREWLRAKRHYQRALEVLVSCEFATGTQLQARTERERLKFKMTKCMVELGENQKAIQAVSEIPIEFRNLEMHIMLGSLYRSSGLFHKAKEYYQAALCQNPYAFEATIALAEIDGSSASMSKEEKILPIENFYLSTYTIDPTQSESDIDNLGWLHTLALAHLASERGQFQLALTNLDLLEEWFPENLHCTLYRGKLEMDRGLLFQAYSAFGKARQIDDLNLAFMDHYAKSLRRNDAKVQLCNLVQDLFQISDEAAIPWLAAAYYSELKQELDTALHFSERAILIDSQYFEAHLFRGTLQLQLNRAEEALLSFTACCKLKKTLDAFAGMINSYCELCFNGSNRYKEALATAKSVVRLYPHNAQSFVLLGNVLMLRDENRSHARRAFQRALSLDNTNRNATFGIVELCIAEEDYTAALGRLHGMANESASEEIFLKLGNIYTLKKAFPEAMEQYNNALSINSFSSAAISALNRLDELMQTQNSDLPNILEQAIDSSNQGDSMDPS
ncbi:hypothetical protein ABG067_000624 [Albugo candida]